MVTGANPTGVWGPRDRGFQMVTFQPQGQVVHLTGQVAWDADEKIVGPGDITAQTQQCFTNIEIILKSIGGTLDDIVSMVTYYTDPTQLPAIQVVRKQMFRSDAAPTSTSIMVAGLGHPDFLVELAPIAVIPFERLKGVSTAT